MCKCKCKCSCFKTESISLVVLVCLYEYAKMQKKQKKFQSLTIPRTRNGDIHIYINWKRYTIREVIPNT